ncbi:MAG: hypothetical protein R3305_05925, partial [Gammaproteobacteria bacterium]|nr:hypothetical protein [Gammaproteobacteria bacterium]
MLNEQIRASTAARERLPDLDGKRFAVDIRGTGLRVIAEATAADIKLRFDAETEPDVELSAGPIDLMLLARSSTLSELKGRDAKLNGDLSTAE